MKNNIILLCVFFILVVIFSDCTPNKKRDSIQLNNVIINSNIKYDSVFNKLNNQNEFFNPLESRDTLNKRSCDILFYCGNINDYTNNDYIRKYKCIAHFYKSDTLYITIEFNDGFSSHGFTLNYINKTFYTKINSTTDMVSDQNDNLPNYKTIYQRLILDKNNYQVGDSVFGKVDFKIYEYNNDYKNEYIGKGYFKSKIIKL